MDFSPFQIIYFSSVVVFGIEIIEMLRVDYFKNVLEQHPKNIIIFSVLFLVFCPVINTAFASAFILAHISKIIKSIKKSIWK